MGPVLWDIGQDVPTQGAVFVAPSDLDDLRELLADSDTSLLRVVLVRPNAIPRLALVQLLVAADEANQISMSSLPEPSKHLLSAARGLVSAVASHDPLITAVECERWRQAIGELEVLSPDSLPPKWEAVEILLRLLASEMLRPMVHGAVFEHTNCEFERRSWWSEEASILRACFRVRAELSRSFPGVAPKSLVGLQKWVTNVQSRVRLMYRPSSAKFGTAFRLAGALCQSLANRHMVAGHTAVGILYLHRALDLVLQGECAEQNLLDFTREGAKYRHGGEEISVKASISLLGSYVALGDLDALHKDLNRWRNLLMQTHYMSSCSLASVRDLFERVSKELKRLGGMSWQSDVVLFGSAALIDLHSLLDVDGSTRDAFDVVNLG